MESLLTKAKKLKSKYEWLQATEYYQKALKLATKENNNQNVAKIQKTIGFCLFRAAYQAKTNKDFQKMMKRAIRAYKKSIDVFQKINMENNSAQIFNLQSKIAILESWLTNDVSKNELLINNWWNLKQKSIKIFEKSNDFHSIGKAYTDLLEHSFSNRMFWLDWYTKSSEFLEIGEKAIEALSKTQDHYELTRAYSWISFYYGFCIFHQIKKNKEDEFKKKCIKYSKQALFLSKKINDAHLLFHVYTSANMEALICKNNPILAIEYTIKALNQGIISKDQNLVGRGKSWASWLSLIIREENPDTHRKRMRQSLRWALDSISNFEIVNSNVNLFPSYRNYVESLIELSSFAVKSEQKYNFLKKAVNIGQEFLKNNKWQNNILYWASQTGLIRAFYLFSKTETNKIKKVQILKKAKKYSEKHANMLLKFTPSFYLWRARTQNYLALIETELAKNEKIKKTKLAYLKKAVLDMEKCLKIMEKDESIHLTSWSSGSYGEIYYQFGDISKYLYELTGKTENRQKATEAYYNAIEIFQRTELVTHAAESYWKIAAIQSQNDDHIKAAKSYDRASRNYQLATQKYPKLADFYSNYSKYMKAWSQIEQARYSHYIEDYQEARNQYKQAAKLHEITNQWNYLTTNYLAWADMEDAESLSRSEQTKLAKQMFQKALQQFNHSKETIEEKLEKSSSEEENEMIQKLLQTSDLRQKYCQARILMEEAKLLDKKGKFLQSSKCYEQAAQNISAIVEKVEAEAEQKELQYILLLCLAWKNMAKAEETNSSESYLEAAEFFDNAKKYCYTKKASLWALGNSNFCKGLAAGMTYQHTLSLSDNALAKRYIKNAAKNYLQAGYKKATEYAQATQRLFDAYIYMNQAESEVDPKNKAKQYQLTEKLLTISLQAFMKAKQPEKIAQVQQILSTVREEKALAISLNQVMQAPTIASSTTSFTAPTSTRESSIGLENFEHANIQANLIVKNPKVKVGESLCLSIEFVNAGKEPALLMKVDDLIPKDFIIVKKPEIYRIEDSCLNLKGKQITSLKLVETKVTLQPVKKGIYQVKPKVHYLDERGQNKTLQLKQIELKVTEVILEDRISTGTEELDSLLFGGIPKEYAVVLSASPSDQRELLIKNFLREGVSKSQTTFYVTTETQRLENLLDKQNFHLFLCNPKPKTPIPDQPNILKIRSKSDINNLSMALARESRNLPEKSEKRICINVVSDVLVDYGVKTTRKWISELITDLGSKGFTIFAVMNPAMHPADQANAVLDLFDGEIAITQSDDPLDCKKSVQVKKLRGQDYIKNPICLT